MQLPPNAWLVLQVQNRAELRVATLLQQKAYEYFLPMQQMRNTENQEHRNVPLFKGYVFCRHNPNALPLIVTTPGVVRILSFGGVPATVEDSEIRAIKHVIASGNDYRPSPYISVGQKIRVLEGPLQGVKGILKLVKNRRTVVISVDLLTRSVEVEIGSCSVEAVSPDAAALEQNKLALPYQAESAMRI